MLAAGILLARLVGIHRKSWAQTIIGRIRPSCRVERTIGAGGRVARPMRRGTIFPLDSAKLYWPSWQKKLTKLPSGGLNRGPSPSNPQQIPLGWPKRPPKTAHFCCAIFLCQCDKVGPSIGVAANLQLRGVSKFPRSLCSCGVDRRRAPEPFDAQ